MPKKQSRTVDLRGLTLAELRAIVAAGWELERFDHVPAAAFPALTRLHKTLLQIDATDEGQARALLELFGKPAPDVAVTVFRVDRVSLGAFAEALRPVARTSADPAMGGAVAKIEARLSRRVGRPAMADLWKQRAADVRRVKRELRQRLGYEPTDDDAAAALGVPPGTVRTWRQRHRDLFDAPKSS